MHRFFVAPETTQNDHVRVDGPVARQVAQVLRLRPGEQVVLMDDSGCEYVITLQSVSPSLLEGDVVEKRDGLGNPKVALTIYQGLLKADKFETVLQKGTEIGISTFVPVVCSRSVPRASKGWADGKYTRWLAILKEAAEQSGRATIPRLQPTLSLKNALSSAPGVRLMAWEGETERGFRETIKKHAEDIKSNGLSFFVGPEGGFDPHEADEARDAGVVPVSLGRRILRGETAGLAIAAAVMYHMGDLGR